MNNNKKIPKLRFPEFADEWETKTLGEVGTFQTSSVDKLSKSNEKEVYLVNYMNVYRHEDINNETTKTFQVVTAKDSQITSCNLIKGDILFTPSSETPNDIGHSVVVLEDLKNAVFSYHLVRFRPKIEIDILYSHYFCNTKFVFDQLHVLANGLTRFTISLKSFSSVKISLPCIAEQQKIASFFSTLDKKIALQRKKVSNAEQLLKGFSQQIFSQKLRFKDQNGNDFPKWETKTLGEVMHVPEKIKVTNVNKDKLLTVRLHRKGVCKNENTKTLKLGKTNYFIRKKGQFIYGKQNLFNGAFDIIPDKFDGFYSSADIPTLDINNDKTNAFYLLYFLGRKFFYKQLERLATGTGSKRIHESLLLDLEIKFPALPEQHKIASFLSLLDKKVELEKKRLKNLEQQKKYFLQQMFV